MKDAAPRSNPLQFRRFYPGPRVSAFVRNFWALRIHTDARVPKPLRIVPDGCIDIVFGRAGPTDDYKGRVAGMMTRPIIEELSGHVDFLGVRFAPGGFGHFFTVPPGELTDQVVPLESLSTSLATAMRLSDADSIREQLALLEADLVQRLRPGRDDSALARILATIRANKGDVAITQLARAAGWSPRHLRRAFRDSVGVGPKVFCRIVRFKHALRALRGSRRPDFLRICLDAGYYDQAHFIHDFRSFYGSTPSAAVSDSHF